MRNDNFYEEDIDFNDKMFFIMIKFCTEKTMHKDNLFKNFE